jgi:methionyl-tRNA formyltransferase
MNLAIIMNDNSYAGREYLSAMKKAGIKTDVIAIGSFPEVNESEDNRCGNLWKPDSMKTLSEIFSVIRFQSLKDDKLIEFLSMKKYDLGIQGGTGILKENIINEFRLGILNFHPGDIPEYRGCSAPEWQLHDNRSVVSTCHLLDQGIDTGKIIAKKTLDLSVKSYEAFRAGVYPQTANFLVEILSEIIVYNGFLVTPQIQDESKAVYRKYIGDVLITDLKNKFPLS